MVGKMGVITRELPVVFPNYSKVQRNIKDEL